MTLVLVTMVILSVKTSNFKLYDHIQMTWTIFNPLEVLYHPPHSTQSPPKTKYCISHSQHYFACTSSYYDDKQSFDTLDSNIHVQVGRVRVLARNIMFQSMFWYILSLHLCQNLIMFMCLEKHLFFS
eukprot:235571_1